MRAVLPLLPPVEEVVMGDNAACVLTKELNGGTDNREVWCWGRRYGAQTGRGTHFGASASSRNLP